MKIKLHVTKESLCAGSACTSGFQKLLEWHADRHIHLEYNTPINLLTVLQSNGWIDMWWCFSCAIVAEDKPAAFEIVKELAKRYWKREGHSDQVIEEAFANRIKNNYTLHNWLNHINQMAQGVRDDLIDLLCNENRREKLLLLIAA